MLPSLPICSSLGICHIMLSWLFSNLFDCPSAGPLTLFTPQGTTLFLMPYTPSLSILSSTTTVPLSANEPHLSPVTLFSRTKNHHMPAASWMLPQDVLWALHIKSQTDLHVFPKTGAALLVPMRHQSHDPSAFWTSSSHASLLPHPHSPYSSPEHCPLKLGSLPSLLSGLLAYNPSSHTSHRRQWSIQNSVPPTIIFYSLML